MFLSMFLNASTSWASFSFTRFLYSVKNVNKLGAQVEPLSSKIIAKLGFQTHSCPVRIQLCCVYIIM